MLSSWAVNAVGMTVETLKCLSLGYVVTKGFNSISIRHVRVRMVRAENNHQLSTFAWHTAKQETAVVPCLPSYFNFKVNSTEFLHWIPDISIIFIIKDFVPGSTGLGKVSSDVFISENLWDFVPLLRFGDCWDEINASWPIKLVNRTGKTGNRLPVISS